MDERRQPKAYRYETLAPEQALEPFVARLCVVLNARFLVKGLPSEDLAKHLAELEFRRSRKVRGFKRSLWGRSAGLLLLAVLFFMASLQSDLPFFYVASAVCFTASFYGAFYCWRRLRYGHRCASWWRQRQTQATLSPVYVLADQERLIWIEKGHLNRFAFSQLDTIEEDAQFYYLSFKGFSRFFPLEKKGLLMGSPSDLAVYLKRNHGASAVVQTASSFSLETLLSGSTDIDLGREGLRMWQLDSGFRSGEDGVCLAHFAAQEMKRVRETEGLKESPCFMDLGSSSGMVALLLSALNPQSQGILLELLPRQILLASENIRRNQLSARLQVAYGDARCFAHQAGQVPTQNLVERLWLEECQSQFGESERQTYERCVQVFEALAEQKGQLDFLVCNPPYRAGQGRRALNEGLSDLEKRIARFDVFLTPRNLASVAAFFLKERGRVSVIFPLARMNDLQSAMASEGFVLEHKRSVRGWRDQEAKLCLLTYGRAVAQSYESEPLVLREQDGAYTEEAKQMYEGEA